MNGIVKLASKLGESIFKASKEKKTAFLIVVLSIFSPIGFIVSASLIAHAYKNGKNRQKRRRRTR